MSNLPIGQGLAVTPLQMATAYAAIANGGLRPPRVVEAVDEAAARAARRAAWSAPAVRRPCGDARGVLAPGGTASEVSIPGYRLAGKTGTAQQPDPDHGETTRTRSLSPRSWSCRPLWRAPLLVAVMVDEPPVQLPAAVVVAGVAGGALRAPFCTRRTGRVALAGRRGGGQPTPPVLADPFRGLASVLIALPVPVGALGSHVQTPQASDAHSRRRWPNRQYAGHMDLRELMGEDARGRGDAGLAYDSRGSPRHAVLLRQRIEPGQPRFAPRGRRRRRGGAGGGAAPLGLGVPEVVVEYVRAAMAPAAARFYAPTPALLAWLGMTGTMTARRPLRAGAASSSEAAGPQCGHSSTVTLGGRRARASRCAGPRPRRSTVRGHVPRHARIGGPRLRDGGLVSCARTAPGRLDPLGGGGLLQLDPGPPGLPRRRWRPTTRAKRRLFEAHRRHRWSTWTIELRAPPGRRR